MGKAYSFDYQEPLREYGEDTASLERDFNLFVVNRIANDKKGQPDDLQNPLQLKTQMATYDKRKLWDIYRAYKGQEHSDSSPELADHWSEKKYDETCDSNQFADFILEILAAIFVGETEVCEKMDIEDFYVCCQIIGNNQDNSPLGRRLLQKIWSKYRKLELTLFMEAELFEDFEKEPTSMDRNRARIEAICLFSSLCRKHYECMRAMYDSEVFQWFLEGRRECLQQFLLPH